MTPEQIADDIVRPWARGPHTIPSTGELSRRIADAIRAAAVDEDLRRRVGVEIGALLDRLREQAEGPLPGGTQYHVGESGIDRTLLDRLAFLLGLPPTARAFLAAADEAPDREAKETTWVVLADWLEEQQDNAPAAEGFRRLVPRTGDVFVFRAKRGARHADYPAMRQLAETIEGRQRALGRDVHCMILPAGHTLNQLGPEEMRRLGWMKTSEYDAAIAALAHELTGQSEVRARTLRADALLAMIRRLKRENAEGRGRAVALVDALAQQFEADQEPGGLVRVIRGLADAIRRGEPPQTYPSALPPRLEALYGTPPGTRLEDAAQVVIDRGLAGFVFNGTIVRRGEGDTARELVIRYENAAAIAEAERHPKGATVRPCRSCHGTGRVLEFGRERLCGPCGGNGRDPSTTVARPTAPSATVPCRPPDALPATPPARHDSRPKARAEAWRQIATSVRPRP